MSSIEQETPSTRPYLIRALHEWCVDHGFSPYIAVQVDASVQVPMEFVQHGEIVLNVSFDATSSLRLGNDFIEFKARFGGVAREIVVPVSHVVAIYARENGQGMAFPPPSLAASPAELESEALKSDAVTPDSTRSPNAQDRGTLRAVPNEGAPTESTDPLEPPPDGPSRGSGRPQLKRVK
ncbi:MAG: ClpXP protease specificity-enhancing factor [Burkholderiales bacterium RIFCSPLOWO2_12_67_14]|nr:MAG: ClpXP protease specificity-enhancing factor [Burkholderiales bacterium RIFCSPLOWO2_02_FULL_67_64]OGB42339.1 MAG: ClpXP protease specificity-enhancing factor [Burkholderiales bacterium RIFCSPLOWO2_12_67_14]OGB42502.1 MAG: ClpXP protease specificity-enhancing factor [Burkholderiales bacterium RIFCSPHIGHO2_12_FULL_67_38]OGB75121.1 MAG: ClpXP protease specificity-enhancing factor [Burkholderiales bacterium RIFCSPLOWO2_12_FULL_67_210]